MVSHRNRERSAPEALFAPGLAAVRMERLWSLAGATSGNRWQIGRPRKRRNQAKTVATGCDQLPWDLDGKEGVDGSSPSEGLQNLCSWGFSFRIHLLGAHHGPLLAPFTRSPTLRPCQIS